MSGSYANDGPERRRLAEPASRERQWTGGVVAVVALIAALAIGDLVFTAAEWAGRHPAALTAVQAAPRPATAVSASPAPAASGTARPGSGAAASLLTVASAAAFGPDGTSDGDHPNLAPGIVSGGGPGWQSSWYATPEFGDLKPGTGLLLDMGKAVDLSRVRLALGTAPGADVQVRVGGMSLPGDMPVVASASDVGGTVQLRLNSPVSGRYVLIWFTRLPAIAQGKYQVSVYSAAVYGTNRT